MTHIEQVATLPTKPYLVIKPARTINVGDKVIFEAGDAQQEETVIDNTTAPGLMKGWQLLEFERKEQINDRTLDLNLGPSWTKHTPSWTKHTPEPGAGHDEFS